MMRTSVCAILTALAFRLHYVAAATPRQAATSSLAARRLDDGDLKFHETTFIASHNAHAALAVAEGFLEPLGANQDDNIIDQLTNDGVRALLLDIKLNEAENEPLRLVHSASFITLDYGGFRSGLGSNLIPFLEQNEDAVISFFLEVRDVVGENTATVRNRILGQLQGIFSSLTVNGVSLKDMTFKYDHDLWKDHEDWPRLDEIRQSGQRIFVFSDRSEFVDTEYGFMYNRHVLQENNWEGIDECEARYMWRSEKVSLPSNDYWTRLFFMNHFCCGSGPDSNGNTVGQNLIGGGNNGWGNLYPRVQQCMSNNGGFKPNFIALDWVTQSKEAKEIREYLNFGGRLGTGQTCTENSHCATSSCNVVLGVCQCQQCPSDRVDVCLGCESGQYCSSPGGEEMNTCRDKESQSNSPSKPTVNPTKDGTHVPSQSPTDTNVPSQSPTEGVTDVSNQYCGETWDATLSSCNEAVKCPGGNDDCPGEQVCYASVDCTPPPTLSPSDKPSYFPSSILDAALSQIGSGAASSTTTNTHFCGTDFFETQDNCQEAIPCPELDGNKLCAYLGSDYTCFSNIVCDSANLITTGWVKSPTTKPTPPPVDSSWLGNLGMTKAPANPKISPPPTRAPSDAPTRTPTLRPTKAPFDFSNKFYCGANYTDAEDNCYKRSPCPTGSPTICNGGTCYGGITCTAPPSISPSSSPTSGPTKYPSKASLFNGSPGGQSQGSQSQGSQFDGNQLQGSQSQGGEWDEDEVEAFDMETFQNRGNSGMVKSANQFMSGKIAGSITIAIGLLGLLI